MYQDIVCTWIFSSDSDFGNEWQILFAVAWGQFLRQFLWQFLRRFSKQFLRQFLGHVVVWRVIYVCTLTVIWIFPKGSDFGNEWQILFAVAWGQFLRQFLWQFLRRFSKQFLRQFLGHVVVWRVIYVCTLTVIWIFPKGSDFGNEWQILFAVAWGQQNAISWTDDVAFNVFHHGITYSRHWCFFIL